MFIYFRFYIHRSRLCFHFCWLVCCLLTRLNIHSVYILRYNVGLGQGKMDYICGTDQHADHLFNFAFLGFDGGMRSSECPCS